MALIPSYKQSALLFEMPRAEVLCTTSACHWVFKKKETFRNAAGQLKTKKNLHSDTSHSQNKKYFSPESRQFVKILRRNAA